MSEAHTKIRGRDGFFEKTSASIETLPSVTATGIAPGLALARSRATGGFDEWAGNVGAHPLLSGELAEHRSPTGLEAWATCPFRYYLDKVKHDDVDVDKLANATVHYSPARIKNIVNEGLIFALQAGREPYAPHHGDVYRKRSWSAVLTASDNILQNPEAQLLSESPVP